MKWDMVGAITGATSMLGVVMLTALKTVFVTKKEFVRLRGECQKDFCTRIASVHKTIGEIDVKMDKILVTRVEEVKQLDKDRQRTAVALTEIAKELKIKVKLPEL